MHINIYKYILYIHAFVSRGIDNFSCCVRALSIAPLKSSGVAEEQLSNGDVSTTTDKVINSNDDC
jgi:hypothetical protein